MPRQRGRRRRDSIRELIASFAMQGSDYLNSVPYLRAISRICSRVSCFGGMPGGLQVSRKKPSRPAGAIVESKRVRDLDFANPCQVFLGIKIVPLLKSVRCIVQCQNSAAFQDEEGFVHPEMPVDRNARPEHYLLGPQGEAVGTCRVAGLDIDVAMVAKMNQMFPFGGPEEISLWRGGLSWRHTLRE